MINRAAQGVALALALSSPVRGDDAIYPAAQCAALWFGQYDYAGQSAFMDRHPADLVLAEAFRAVAMRLAPRRAAEIDIYITTQRPLMALLVDTYVYAGDRQSRDVYETLMADCAAFAATQPETRDLR